MAIETVTVTKQEAQLIEEAKAMRKAMAEQEALKVKMAKQKAKKKSNYNAVMSVLLIGATFVVLFVEGKLG